MGAPRHTNMVRRFAYIILLSVAALGAPTVPKFDELVPEATLMREIDTNKNGVVESAEFVATGETEEASQELSWPMAETCSRECCLLLRNALTCQTAKASRTSISSQGGNGIMLHSGKGGKGDMRIQGIANPCESWPSDLLHNDCESK